MSDASSTQLAVLSSTLLQPVSDIERGLISRKLLWLSRVVRDMEADLIAKAQLRGEVVALRPALVVLEGERR